MNQKQIRRIDSAIALAGKHQDDVQLERFTELRARKHVSISEWMDMDVYVLTRKDAVVFEKQWLHDVIADAQGLMDEE